MAQDDWLTNLVCSLRISHVLNVLHYELTIEKMELQQLLEDYKNYVCMP